MFQSISILGFLALVVITPFGKNNSITEPLVLISIFQFGVFSFVFNVSKQKQRVANPIG